MVHRAADAAFLPSRAVGLAHEVGLACKAHGALSLSVGLLLLFV